MTASRLKAEDIKIFSDAATAFFQATTGSKASVRTAYLLPSDDVAVWNDFQGLIELKGKYRGERGILRPAWAAVARVVEDGRAGLLGGQPPRHRGRDRQPDVGLCPPAFRGSDGHLSTQGHHACAASGQGAVQRLPPLSSRCCGTGTKPTSWFAWKRPEAPDRQPLAMEKSCFSHVFVMLERQTCTSSTNLESEA